MNTTKNLEAKLTGPEQMELIWVKNGIKPVGEIKEADYGKKFLLDQSGLFNDFYGKSLFYSANKGYLNDIKEATHSGDSIKAGKLWGFPKCCTEYFDKLKSYSQEPAVKSLEMVKKVLQNGGKAYAYFNDRVYCPDCISNRNSQSGELDKKLAEILKSEDPKLYKEFLKESDGEIILLKGSEGQEFLLWDYRHSK